MLVSDVITLAQEASGLAYSSYVSEVTWTSWVNEVLSELYDIVIENYEDNVLSSDDISIVSNTDTYALPDDFYKCAGVDFYLGQITGAAPAYTLKRYMFAERNMYRSVQPFFNITSPFGPILRYAIRGQNIVFMPVPQGLGVIRLWYIPQFTTLALGGTLPSWLMNGWEQYIAYGAALKAVVKQDRDPSSLAGLKAEQKDRIIKASPQRDVGEPPRVVDIYAINFPFGGVY